MKDDSIYSMNFESSSQIIPYLQVAKVNPMKKYRVLLFVFLIAHASIAQKSNRDSAISNFQSATELIANGNLKEGEVKLVAAKNAIDLAVKHTETASDFKTLKTMGEIYMELNTIWSKEQADKSHEAAVMSLEGFRKAKELTSKQKELDEIDKQLRNLQINTYNQAITNYNETNFNVANNLFIFSSELAEYRGELDGQQLYVTAMSCDMVRNYQDAFNYYRKCVALDYGDSKLYAAMLNSAVLSDNDLWIKITIIDGKAKYPNDQDFTIAVANAYLQMDNFVGAEELLLEAIDNDPSNAQIAFGLGAVYEKLGKTERAIEAYEATLNIDPNHFEATYSIGASYFNQAAKIQQELNSLDYGSPEEKELMRQHKELMEKSRTRLEKAYELNANDYSTVYALMNVYAQLEQMDDYAKMKAEFERIKNGY
jgi:tetratricopeptide (TPR) repeat protein